MPCLYRYQFGRSSYDESKAELTVNGLSVDIQPQSLRILSILLAHCGEVVSRQELEEQVWCGRHVGENVLASAITRLRASLGASNAGLIEAIPRIGYRITGQVQRTAVGQDIASALELGGGMAVPGRSEFVLERILARSHAGEVWLARHGKTKLARVFKFGVTATQLRSLKREVTLARVLQEHLGARRDLVQILDWNFEQVPFFIESEYGGEDLLSWSQAPDHLAPFSQADRLALFCQMAQTVAAAHGVAVLHKDLKPANVLVSKEESGWQLKLVDFGSGVLTDPERLRDLGLTQMSGGPQTLQADTSAGSLMYIAPEILRGEAATERCDVYALGVILYQLLVGDLRRPMVPGWDREIADPILREEIARATDGDPEHRTSSVHDLLSQLNDLPAKRAEREREAAALAQQARDRESALRAKQRRPWIFVTIGALIFGLATTLYAYVKLEQSEMRLQHQNHNVQALNRFLAEDLIGAANPKVIGHPSATVKEAIQLAADRIDALGANFSEDVHASLHVAMQKAFNSAEEYKQALHQGDLALAELTKAPNPDLESIEEVRLGYVESLNFLSRIKDATQQLDLLEQSLQRHSGRPTETQALYWYWRGRVAESAYDWEPARQDLVKARELLGQVVPHSAKLENYVEHEYAEVMRLGGHLPESIALYRQLLRRVEAKYGPNNLTTCSAKIGLAAALTTNKQTTEGIPLAMQALTCYKAVEGVDSGDYATALTIIAEGYVNNQQWRQAADWYRQAETVYAKVNGEGTVETLVARLNLADSLQKMGESAEALQKYREALRGAQALLPAQHPLVLNSRFYVAAGMLDQGQTKGVFELLDGLDAKTLNEGDEDAAWDGMLSYERGRLHLLLGEKAAGIAALEYASKELRAKAPEDRKDELKNIDALLAKARS